MIGKWILNILIGIDQLGNCIIGGDPDETISSRLGKLKLRHGGSIPWYRPLSRIVDWGLDKIDPHHSIDAIEEDEGSEAVLDRENHDLLKRLHKEYKRRKSPSGQKPVSDKEHS